MTRIGPLFESSLSQTDQTRAAFAEAARICARLREAGHVAYFAGGCVRDALLGREPKDFDVATDATPDRVREVFGKRRTLAFGASFGVIGVLADGKRNNQMGPTEVATFRSDGEYSDGRRPDRVHFGDARHDALRRDFTINGLFFDPADERVIDFVGGQEDLDAKRLRTIGSATDRFEEDKLRMLRAARFATTLGFQLDADTKSEMIKRSDEIRLVSGERIGAEMRRIVESQNAARGLELLVECGLHTVLFPQLESAETIKLRELLDARTSAVFESSMALVLLALSSPDDTTSQRSMTDQVGRAWRLSSEEIRRIKSGLSHWRVLSEADQKPWSVVQPVLVDRDALTTLQVAEAVVAVEGLDRSGVALCRRSLDLPAEQLDPAPLVTGATLQQRGHRPGPHFKVWLQQLRDAQLDGKVTDRQQAFEMLAEIERRDTNP